MKLLATETFPANQHSFEDGLTVIHQYLPTSPVVTVDVWVRAGAIAEPDSWSGMAHFLEHMIFKGTEHCPPGYFDHVIETCGGVANAATSHDYAHFFINVASPYLEEGLHSLAELLLRAAIPDDEFGRERDVVLEELRQAQDDPDWVGYQALMESLYRTHPYGRSVLGTEETLMGRSPDEMRQFHQMHYQPENMTVVVIGDVELAPTLDLVRKAFNGFLPRVRPTAQTPIKEKPVARIHRQEMGLSRVEQARLLMAWQGPGIDQLHEAYGLDLLSVALAGGRSARLVRELREERQLVHAVGSNFSLQRESSLFMVSAWLEPDHLDMVEAIIGDRLSELAERAMSDKELSRYKCLLCNDYAFSTETANQLAGLYGYYNTIAKAELSTTYPAHIQSFQAEDLRSIAQHYLSPQRYAAMIIKPLD
ncbi:MAG: pitrilysin family protein [Leptolyngbyaceae bacterium]|nr:pitrilysin family protein [Leptolyngbyaceae bacterium]